MHGDQRFASKRPDVLTYQTELLREDITVVGPITAELFVSTDKTDADWIVKIIDVFPDEAEYESPNENVDMKGYQMLVRGDIMRGKYRQSFEKTKAFEPNKVTKVEFTILDINHTFKAGHKLMIQVQSSWFPLYDRNPQKYVDNIYKYYAAYGMIAFIDAPISFGITRWYRSIHPVVFAGGENSGLEPPMLITFIVAQVGMLMLGYAIYQLRMREARAAERLEALKMSMEGQ